jgi:phosphatidylserine/phosphatidylglycerophosphate/cardiolipin synthase-like enzyme
VIGGRNIHEGYFFEEPRALGAWPFLHQYDPDNTKLTGGFTAYEDFEIEFLGGGAVRNIVGHMAALWHRDQDSQRPRAPLETRAAPPVHDGMMRHFLSVPFADDTAQIGYFAAIFDAARESIHIAIPYLNLPPELDAALRRARDRGVEVEIVTTVRVREAADFMVTGLNRTFANAFGDWVDFVDYDPYPRLLHAKLFVIDGRLTMITSTNLNQRSFYHDLENGVVILDRATARRIDAVIAAYRVEGVRVLPGQPVPGIVRWLRGIRTILRVF